MFCKTRHDSARRGALRGLVGRLLCVLAGMAFAPVEAAEPAALLQQLQQWLDDTRDLQGRFEQSLVSGALGAGTSESGVFFLERPGRMRWDYLDPEKKVAIVRDEQTWFYVAEDAQLMRGRIDGSELLLRLLAGGAPLDQLFDVAPTASEGSARNLALIPRGAEMESFQQVVLSLGKDEASIDGAEVLDVGGNRVVYRFRDLRRNVGLPPAVFTFEPPAGTVIVGEH